ncbi:MAG: DUF6691 family protein [Alphaproteobacteria bacterium]
MAQIFAAAATGLLFGIGLVLSQMVNPAKVINFLDLFGAWDPSLAFVMGSALLTAAIGYRFVLKQPAPSFADTFQLPTAKDIDLKLVGGAALFGIGWGLSGYCPGPAIVGTGLAITPTLIFLVTMLAGMGLYRLQDGVSLGGGTATPQTSDG